jgi:hypothetical protein
MYGFVYRIGDEDKGSLGSFPRQILPLHRSPLSRLRQLINRSDKPTERILIRRESLDPETEELFITDPYAICP